MSQPEKKLRSASAAERSEKGKKPVKRGAPIEHDPNPELHSPWLPLVWLLVPLLACIIYGVATRGK